MTDGPLDPLPLWLVCGGTIAAVLVAIEIGFRLGRQRRLRPELEGEAPVNAMVGATLGLLAFLLAFTFGLAASYFEKRRGLVLEEANAIGTTFLRTSFLPEPERNEVRRLLRNYVQARLDALAPGALERSVARSNELHEQLWAQAAAAATKAPASIMVGLFIQSLNETIDLHAKRLSAGARIRIPASIWGVLYFIIAIAMMALGYHEGLGGKRRSYVTLALALSFSAVILLIADLDRPAEGLLRTGQQPLLDLQQTMKSAPP